MYGATRTPPNQPSSRTLFLSVIVVLGKVNSRDLSSGAIKQKQSEHRAGFKQILRLDVAIWRR